MYKAVLKLTLDKYEKQFNKKGSPTHKNKMKAAALKY